MNTIFMNSENSKTSKPYVLNQYKHEMNTIFMNSGNSKTSKPYVLILELNNKIDLQRGKKNTALSNLSIDHAWKAHITWKAHIISINLKFQLQHDMINLNYQMDHILYQIFNIILIIS